MLSASTTLAVAFVLVCVFGYWTHRFLHSPKSGKLNKSHMAHHLKLYPATDFFSETYRDPGKDNTVFIFGALSLPLLFLPVLLHLLGTMSLGLTLAVVGEMLVLGWLHNFLHDAFHIKNHWLDRFSLFREWIDLHFQHHEDSMSRNYGIFNFWCDRIWGTFSPARYLQ